MSDIKIFIETRIELDDGRGAILDICKNNNILITKINRVNNGFKLSIETSREAEKIFEAGIKPIFERAGLNPKLPPSLKCKRTLLLINPDEFILNQNTDEIISEINSRNQNSGIYAVDAFKIPRSSIIKLEFSTAEMSNTVLNRGLNMFYLHQPGRKFTQDILININYCDNCQKMESHATVNCPERQSTCPKCSKNGHKDCNTDPSNFKCTHCNQNHHSRSFKCPERKKKLVEKRNNLRKPKTYSQITKKFPSSPIHESFPSRAFPHPVRQPLLPTPSLTPALNVITARNPQDNRQNSMISDQVDTAKTNSKIFTVLQFSLLKEMECPGSFPEVYKKLCQKNDLPEINLDEYELPNRETIKKIMGGHKPDQDESLFVSTLEGNYSHQSSTVHPDDMTLVSQPTNPDATRKTQMAEKLPKANEKIPPPDSKTKKHAPPGTGSENIAPPGTRANSTTAEDNEKIAPLGTGACSSTTTEDNEKIAPLGTGACSSITTDENIAPLGTGANLNTTAETCSTLEIPPPPHLYPQCSTPNVANKKTPPKIEVWCVVGTKISTSRLRITAFKDNKLMITDQYSDTIINKMDIVRKILEPNDVKIKFMAQNDFSKRLAQYSEP